MVSLLKISLQEVNMMQNSGMSEHLSITDDSNQPNTTRYGNNSQTEETPIQTFYAGQSIFITGGTGFLGKILIEKLLRSCPNISQIYMMIRSKRNKSAASRLDEIFENSLFDRVRKEMPNFRDKVVPIMQIGELEELDEEDLKLTKNDIDLLISKVSIIFHLAATVRFNEHIKFATTINVYITRAIMNLAKRMPNLKSFIHVSTITANCFTRHIDETFYKYPINFAEFIRLMRSSSENTIDQKILKVALQWPNSYTFTKAIAEMFVRDNSKNLPVGIFRPSIVLNTAREPLVGWIDNYYGTMGLLVSFCKGLLRFYNCNSDCVLNIVPVDITINALIVAAWDVFNQPYRRGDKMLIYNCVSTNDAPITLRDYQFHAHVNNRKYPTKDCYWMPTFTFISNKVLYTIYIWFGHLLPALFIEIFQRCKRSRQSIWRLYGKIHEYNDMTSYFVSRNWTYSQDNVHAMWRSMSKNDQFLFDFDMKGFDWPKYLEDHYKGMRFYLLKDDLSTLEVSRNKWNRLYWIHQATKIMFILIFMFIVFFTCV